MYKFHTKIKNVESSRGPKETSESGFIFCLLNVRDMSCAEIAAICAHNAVKMTVKTVERCKVYWDLRQFTSENSAGQRTLTERARAHVQTFSAALREIAAQYVANYDARAQVQVQSSQEVATKSKLIIANEFTKLP